MSRWANVQSCPLYLLLLGGTHHTSSLDSLSRLLVKCDTLMCDVISIVIRGHCKLADTV